MIKASDLRGGKGLLILVTAVLFSLTYLYFNSIGVPSTSVHRGLYFLFTGVLGFLIYPTSKNRGGPVFIAIDAILIAALAFASIWWMLDYPNFAMRVGDPNTMDLVIGTTLTILSLELGRRIIGRALPILALIFLGYNYLGAYLPPMFAIRGTSYSGIIDFTAMRMEGLFGGVIGAFASYLVPFAIFGGFLEMTGGGDFFLDLAKSMTGGWRGGPAKIAVVASGFFGSISGSSVANVVSTGTFTIPMMKKVGYKPHFAGAVEAAASTGGQFMPPIMGAGAFIIAELTDTPYWRVAAMAIIPALMYYLTVILIVHLRAVKTGLMGLPAQEIPPFGKTLKGGWFFFLPLLILIYLLFKGYSPGMAAFFATAVLALIGLIKTGTKARMKPREYLNALAEGGLTNVVGGASAPVLGLIMGGIVLSGLAISFSSIIIELSGGSLFLIVLFVCVAAVLVGTSATVTASYLIIALLATPALNHFGIPTIVTHLVCFWTANFSGLTPPVCVVAFTAAAVAKADLYKTAFASMKLAVFMFVSPFAFVFFPESLGLGTFGAVSYFIVCYMLGIILFCEAIEGFIVKSCSLFERLALFGGAILLFKTGLVSDLIGILIGLAIFLRQKFSLHKAAAGPVADAGK